MVNTYINNENTLILLAITMKGEYFLLRQGTSWQIKRIEDDIDNQGAADLARLADPNGSRTIGKEFPLHAELVLCLCLFIGVLTKPDTIERGHHNEWLAIMDGIRHPLKCML